MFDFFKLPTNFPGYAEANKLLTSLRKVEELERYLAADIDFDRFIPYIQLHEFEALLFSDINILKYEYFEEASRIDKLYQATRNIAPEDINHGAETAPSKRIMTAIPYQKGDSSAELLEALGVEKIRKRCPHFSAWLGRLEDLR